jgi:hypothetical protein
MLTLEAGDLCIVSLSEIPDYDAELSKSLKILIEVMSEWESTQNKATFAIQNGTAFVWVFHPGMLSY